MYNEVYMLPILISVGPIKIYSMGVFLFLGLFAGLYWWWKIGRDEHWEETRLFDSYFLSLISFFVGGRAVYVLTHPELYSIARALGILAYPGINWVGGIAIAGVMMWFLSRRFEWEGWKVFDAWATVLSTVMLIASVGAILNGSNPGRVVPWGLSYPGSMDKHIPVDIWTFLWSLISFATVSRVRKYFRFYSWYKGDASVAKDGLAGLVLVMLSGFYYLVAGIIDANIYYWGAILILISGCMIVLRSGKNRGSELLDKLLRRNKS